MRTLSTKQCIKLLKKYKVPRHIFLHSRKVNGISMFLAEKANKKGYNLNLRLIDNASLLHDIEKMNSVNNKTPHAVEGEKTLIKEGFPEIAVLVGTHVMPTMIKIEKLSIYQIILFYSDMRVVNDKVVSLKDRYEYLKERYGSVSPEKMKLYLDSGPWLFKLEKDLLKKLGIDADFINELTLKKYLISEVY